jgi:uridine kinase
MWHKQAHKIHSIDYKIKDAMGLTTAKDFAFMAPYFVGVSGGSGSGKTTFCKQFVKLLGEDRVQHISQDLYYKDLAHLPFEERQKTNFDHPDMVEFSLLSAHLDELFLGKNVSLPRYDFSKHVRLPSGDLAIPKPIVLVEGIFFDKSTEKRLNHKIFIDVKEEIRFQRRFNRDTKERGRTPESVQEQFQSTVKPMHNLFVEPAKNKADQIISGESSFENHIRDLCVRILNEAI